MDQRHRSPHPSPEVQYVSSAQEQWKDPLLSLFATTWAKECTDGWCTITQNAPPPPPPFLLPQNCFLILVCKLFCYLCLLCSLLNDAMPWLASKLSLACNCAVVLCVKLILFNTVNWTGRGGGGGGIWKQMKAYVTFVNRCRKRLEQQTQVVSFLQYLFCVSSPLQFCC